MFNREGAKARRKADFSPQISQIEGRFKAALRFITEDTEARRARRAKSKTVVFRFKAGQGRVEPPSAPRDAKRGMTNTQA